MSRFTVNEAFLSQLELLQSLLKHNVAGMFGGNRQSKNYGSSCEFADLRDYVPGDDITKIDWNAYARFEKLYTKLYLDERQMHTRIYIDASRSMDYGAGQKAEQALRLAAAFAYLSVCEMDKVSIYAIREKEVLPLVSGMVGKQSYINCIGALNDLAFEGDSYISEAIMPTSVGRGDGMSILISDFLTDHDYEDAIGYLVDKKRDVLCLQVLSREELNPQLRDKMHLFDSENAGNTWRRNIDRDIAAAYKQALAYATGRIEEFCRARGASYLLVDATQSMGEIFFGSLVDMEVIK
ncbi:MAG: DUF58 domain-containing protein [Clostridia bacterium]|nr:DUF58 domain-containing protein [Clostridia bacterium]